MKAILTALVTILLACPCVRAQTPQPAYDDATRFIFYSVLEGLYEDGLTTQDVDQILMKREGEEYYHFIYSCPICATTIWALQTYRERPPHFYSTKLGGSTFGPGLSKEVHQQLYSGNPRERLTAINGLMKSWMTKRLDATNLTAANRAALLDSLKKKRQDGMDALENFRHFAHGPAFGVAAAAPAYVDLQECAVCNGAVGKLMKLPGDDSPSTPRDP